MAMTYQDVPRTSGERETLLAFLRWQRATLEQKCAGLDASQVRTRAAEPSTLSLLGLVRHMADVERAWFRRTLAQEQVGSLYESPDDDDADFNDIGTQDPVQALEMWREECRLADAVIEQHQLDDVVRQRTGREVSMRWILVHMVEEYSRHNGHADLLRERIDGATGY
jgi:uncharacterized damage-inducible protein DinB